MPVTNLLPMRSLLLVLALTAPSLIHAQCLLFDGVDDRAEVPNVELNNIGTGDFTVEAWVKGVEADQLNHARLFSNRQVIGAGFMFSFHGLWGGSLYKMLCIQLDGLNYVVINNGTYNNSLLDGTCHHLAATRQADTIYYYADGILFGQRIIIGTPTAASGAATAVIGDDSPDPYPFNGNISELRLWNYARSQAEIQSTMDVSIPATLPGLVGYWPMNDGAQSIVDQTGTASGFIGSSSAIEASDPIWFNNCCTVLSTEGIGEVEGAGIQVHGNSVGQLVVELPVGSHATITIVDALGRVAMDTRSASAPTALIDIRALRAGTYIARIEADGAVHAVPFVVQGHVH